MFGLCIIDRIFARQTLRSLRLEKAPSSRKQHLRQARCELGRKRR